jgi:hypothetical protein
MRLVDAGVAPQLCLTSRKQLLCWIDCQHVGDFGAEVPSKVLGIMLKEMCASSARKSEECGVKCEDLPGGERQLAPHRSCPTLHMCYWCVQDPLANLRIFIC